MGPTSHLCYTKPLLLASADSCCQSQEMQLAKELHLQCSWWWIQNDSFFLYGCAVAMLKMGAVEEQQKRFKKLSTNFSKRLAHHLNNLFIHQVIGTVGFWVSCLLPHPPPPRPPPFFHSASAPPNALSYLFSLFQDDVQLLMTNLSLYDAFSSECCYSK